MTSLEKLFNQGLIRREYKRQMDLAYNEYLKRKKLYEEKVDKRIRDKWDKRQERIDG